MSVSLSKLALLHGKMAGRVRYRLGAKASSLYADTSTITHLDCSGYTRYILFRASDGSLLLPDGSWYQQRWCQEHLRRLARYADVHYAAADPSRLFIAFLAPGAIRKRSVGHVWLVRAGETMESYGGKGVGSRPWDTPVLRDHATAAYELPVQA